MRKLQYILDRVVKENEKKARTIDCKKTENATCKLEMSTSSLNISEAFNGRWKKCHQNHNRHWKSERDEY